MLADLSLTPSAAGRALYLVVKFLERAYFNSFLVSGFFKDSSLTSSLNSRSVYGIVYLVGITWFKLTYLTKVLTLILLAILFSPIYLVTLLGAL